MIIGPYVLAIIFGAIVSATLYFVLLWPSREPPDPDDPDDGGDGDAGPGPGERARPPGAPIT